MGNRIEQRMAELQELHAGALEPMQLLNEIKKTFPYPRQLGKLNAALDAEVLSSWPVLSDDMKNVWADSPYYEAPVSPQALLNVLRRHYHQHPVALNDVCRAMPMRLDTTLRRPEAQAWLQQFLEGRVLLDHPINQRFLSTEPVYQGVQYRGEHGSLENGIMQSRYDVYTFSTENVAREYAQSSNERDDIIVDPRLIEAEITLCNPFINNDDCFVDLSALRPLFDTDQEWVAFARTQVDHLCNTNNFGEVLDSYQISEALSGEASFDLLVAEQGPQVLNELYLDAYPVFDNADIIKRVKAQGYDGVIHNGNSVSAMTPEYKVFYLDQVNMKRAVSLASKMEYEIPLRTTLADKVSGTLKPSHRRA